MHPPWADAFMVACGLGASDAMSGTGPVAWEFVPTGGRHRLLRGAQASDVVAGHSEGGEAFVFSTSTRSRADWQWDSPPFFSASRTVSTEPEMSLRGGCLDAVEPDA